MEKISRSGTLNPEKIEVAEKKSETGAGNMVRRKSLLAVNIPTLERLQQQDLRQGIENLLCSINSNPEVGNSFDGITKRSKKQTEKGLACSLQVLFEKRKRSLSRLQRKSENINTLIQSKLNVQTVNEEFNQYDDLLKMFLDTRYQYHSKLVDFQQIEDSNWFDEVDQNIFTFKHLVHNYIQDNEESCSRKSSKSSKSKKSSVSSGSRSSGSSTFLKQ